MKLEYHWLNRQPYEVMWKQMKDHASLLASGKADEVIWACEHEPVYTTGRRGIDNRIAVQLPAPLIITDRGGETTYHGSEQIMLYPMIHLRRRKLAVKLYISMLEQSCLDALNALGIHATRRCGLPGVWTTEGKIAALGVRVSQGVVYHGMALNVNVDMKYFHAIDPCGIGQSAVNISGLCHVLPNTEELAKSWGERLKKLLL